MSTVSPVFRSVNVTLANLFSCENEVKDPSGSATFPPGRTSSAVIGSYQDRRCASIRKSSEPAIA